MSFGNLDKLKKDESFIKALKRLIRMVSDGHRVINIQTICEEERKNWGYIVYHKLWQRFDLGKLIKGILDRYKISFDGERVIELIVLERLICTWSSKRVLITRR